jgi:hypothetical protein
VGIDLYHEPRGDAVWCSSSTGGHELCGEFRAQRLAAAVAYAERHLPDWLAVVVA